MRSDVQGWLSSNALRSYPFKEDAFRIPEILGTDFEQVPPGVLVDLLITTPYSQLKDLVPGFVTGHIPPIFKLREILGTATTLKFTFAELMPGAVEEIDIAEIEVDLSTFEPLSVYSLTGLTPATHGIIVFGNEFLSYAAKLGVGTYVLGDEDGHLEERTVRDNPYARVTSISELEDDAPLLVGDVKLEEGYNIELQTLVDRNGIQINARPGAGLGEFCGRGCAGTFPDTDLVPYDDEWDYKLYGSGGVPSDYFELAFDDSDFLTETMPFRRGVGGSQADFVGLHVFRVGHAIAVRKEIFLPEDMRGLVVEVGMGWDDYIEIYWNEVPITPLIGAGAPL